MDELQVFKEAKWVEPQNRFVFWSGGKDSTVALHLALRVWRNPKVVFVDTGITLPETLEYVKLLTQEWHLNLKVLKPQDVRPDFTFWDYVAKNGFPIHKALWCRRILKMEPIKKFMKSQYGWKVQVLGIRKAESVVRMKANLYDKPFRRHRKISFTYNLLPILFWSDGKVEAYIQKHKIPLNPCYKIYATSGCYYCPFVNNNRHYLALKRLHPDLFDEIVYAESVMRKGHSALVHKYVKEIAKQQFLAVNRS